MILTEHTPAGDGTIIHEPLLHTSSDLDTNDWAV